MMKIASLEATDVDRALLEIWQRTVGEDLLPVQERAVRELNLLGAANDRNLIVFSPTSSGKTFVGEMAAAQAAKKNRLVFYLVPLVALAEEKYLELGQRYASTDIKVVVSSRDHSEFDADIIGLNFGIAVVVYEKLQSLLVAHPALVDWIGLVVVDELQIITDSTRGPSLELLLTKLITAPKRPRIIGLSAVLGRAELLAEWLEADLLVDHHRPVELRKGVLCRGTFMYREHNSGALGTEEFPDIGTDDKAEACLAAAEHLVGLGEQVLVFEETRADTVRNALLLADRIRMPAANEGLEALAERDETLAGKNLRQALESSVAFHNSDLSAEERALVERLFRAGHLRAVFSTPTLAMGVNLPVKNVIVPTDKWGYMHHYRRWIRLEVSKSEYENMSGRAGRYSLTPDFGRSLLITDSKWDAKVWMDCFVDAPFEDIGPTLEGAPLENHLLDLLVSGLAATPKQASEILLRSFTGQTRWIQQLGQQELGERLATALEMCRSTGMLEPGGETLTPSMLGKVCASAGLKVATAHAFARWLHATAQFPIEPLDVLTALSFNADADECYVPMGNREHDEREYKDQLLKEARGLHLLDRPILRSIHESQFSLMYEQGKRVKKVLMLFAWMEEHRTSDIERAFMVWGGTLQRVAEEYGWLAEALAQAAGALGWSQPRQQELRHVGQRISRGVLDDLLPLSQLRVRGLGRVYLRRLAQAGLGDLMTVTAASHEALQAALKHRGLAERLYEHLHQEAVAVGDGATGSRDGAGVAARETATAPHPANTACAPAPVPTTAPAYAPAPTPAPAQAPAPVPAEPQPCKAAEASPQYGSNAPGSAHTLKIVGACRLRRYLIQIDGRDVWLPQQAFSVLCQLADRRRTDPDGWIHHSDLGVISGAHRALSRLRKMLEPYNGESGGLENDGNGSFRLHSMITLTGDGMVMKVKEA